MTDRPATRVRAAVLAAPWAMTPEMVQTILTIAERDNLSPEAVAAQLGRPLDNTRAVTVRDGVAIIPVEGVISRYMSVFSEISGGVSIETLATDLRAALDTVGVHSILLDIDSPGGEAAGVGEFAAMVREATVRKPVVAYVGGMAASAAYWIASAATTIVAAPTAILGSIGVVLAVPDPEKQASRSIEFVSSQSPRKRPNPRTEGGREQLQAIVDDLAALFVGAVAEYRGIDTEAVLAIGGGVLVGEKARTAGLADRLGSYEGVVAELTAAATERRAPWGARLAALGTGEEVGMSHQGFWSKFFGGLGEQMDGEAGFAPVALAAQGPTEVALTAPASALVSGSLLPLTGPAQAGAPSEPDPEVVALRAQLAALRAERQEEVEARMGDAATAFADGEIAACRAFPAEREALVAAYCDAARDDLALGAIAGASADTGGATRVDRLVARSATRPPHTLTQEVVPTREGAATVLANAQRTRFGPTDAQPETPLTPEERDRLLAMTEVGRAVLAERRAAGR